MPELEHSAELRRVDRYLTDVPAMGISPVEQAATRTARPRGVGRQEQTPAVSAAHEQTAAAEGQPVAVVWEESDD